LWEAANLDRTVERQGDESRHRSGNSGTIRADEKEGPMSEVIFIVEEAPEGGLLARAVGQAIFTQAGSMEELHDRVRDAVHCHFDPDMAPKLIRLHFVRDEVIAA
jgi:hypothetical protein